MAKIVNFYPVGILSFSKIREGNYLYVDKTKYIVDFREKPLLSMHIRKWQEICLMVYMNIVSGRDYYRITD